MFPNEKETIKLLKSLTTLLFPLKKKHMAGAERIIMTENMKIRYFRNWK
jgi:hypothetical protein